MVPHILNGFIQMLKIIQPELEMEPKRTGNGWALLAWQDRGGEPRQAGRCENAQWTWTLKRGVDPGPGYPLVNIQKAIENDDL